MSVNAGATDANSGDTLTFSASNLPTGLSINPSTGKISGTPSAAGTFNPTVTVSDGTVTDSQSFSWTISPNNVPVLSAIGNQTGTIGTAVSISPMASDANSESVTWSASGLPAGLSINTGTGVITGTPTTNNAYSTTVSIDDGYGGTDSKAFTFTIANTASVLAMFGAQASTVGEAVNLSPSASDTNGDTISWSATGLPSGLAINAATGEISGTPIALGVSAVTITVIDPSDATDTSTFDWTIIEAAVASEDADNNADISFSPMADATTVPILDSYAMEMFDITRQSIVPAIRMSSKTGLLRLAELRDYSQQTRTNRSSHDIQLAFNDEGRQQISDGGFNALVNDLAGQTADSVLPEGMAIWSRAQSIMGNLKTASTGKLEFDIDRTVNGEDYSATRNGEKMHWMLAASRRFRLEKFDMTVTLDSAYQYLKQEMRTYYVGANVRFSDSFENELGEVTLAGEIGYPADMSDDTVARGFLLADPSTIYEYRMDADDDAQSLSHSNLVLSASLRTEADWRFNASFDFFGYESGTLTGLTILASRAF